MFAIWNETQRKWVANPGCVSSYTSSRIQARKFDTWEEANRNCCGDERVVSCISTYIPEF